jgi:hypothetical protein
VSYAAVPFPLSFEFLSDLSILLILKMFNFVNDGIHGICGVYPTNLTLTVVKHGVEQ